MATVVNNPGTTAESDGGSNSLVGIILLIVFALVVIFYGIPYIANTVGNSVPQTQAPQVQVPEKVDVNVNQNPK